MEERKVPGKNELRKREPVIQVKNLYKVYRVGETKVYALNGVDFTMYRGEFCAIVGTSGSGKSTLLNMLAGLEKPTKGRDCHCRTAHRKIKREPAGGIPPGAGRIYLPVI